MKITHRKQGARIGARGLVFKELLSDTTAGVTYSADIHSAPGLIEVGLTSNITDEALGADDNPVYDQYSSIDSVEAALTLAADMNSLRAFLLGHTIDNNGVMHVNSNDVAPYVAMGWKSKRTDGSVDYTWLYKGKFKEGDGTHRTKEKGKANFQSPQIKATFGPTDYNGDVHISVNDHDDGVPAGVISTFLDSVYGLTPDATIISAALFKVTAPVKAATPQASHDPGTGYTAAIAWNPTAATFAGTTAYTATVTLTATSGYAFDTNFGVKDVTGIPANATSKSVRRTAIDTVIIEVAFPATGA